MLTFITTMTLKDFKEIKKATELEIKRNPNTGKCFFTCGEATGAVSDKFIAAGFKNPAISQVESQESGDSFFLLHSRDEGGTNIIARL